MAGNSRSTGAKGRLPLWAQVLMFLAVMGAVYAARTWRPQEDGNPATEVATNTEAEPSVSSPTTSPATPEPPKLAPPPTPRRDVYVDQEIAHNVQIKDLDGRTLHQGEVTLTATLERIARNEEISRFSNDGSVFSNRERRLPNKPNGYYREWVHPTPGQSGPGPQRIVTGQRGEIYYTPDHYGHFYPVQRK